MTKIAVC